MLDALADELNDALADELNIVVLLRFDVDDLGIARAEAAQFLAYRSGIAFVIEELLPPVVGRPPAVAAIIPAGNSRIGSGSKCDGIGHSALLSLKGVLS
jgi:hypothetical protein